MKAYLEVNNGMWFDDYVYSSVEPLNRLGVQIIKAEELDGYNFDRFKPESDDIFIGSVEGTVAFWKELNITPPSYLGYPGELKEHLHRNVSEMKFSDIKFEDLPLFIKPKNGVKEFPGFVLDKKSTLVDIGMYYSQIKPDTDVYVSEPVNIISEYRVFVHKGEIVGIKHYSGDFGLFPDIDTINAMKMDYEKADHPISYTLDVGIVRKDNTEPSNFLAFQIYKIADYYVQLDDCCTVGRTRTTTTYNTILIEVNDFWAIGGYGLDGKIYTRMLIDRFQEIKSIK
jgi:hypothetical protein